ncbi:hypothetical protein [Maliponia aquimaris]|uniref:hypothetical protein n=1 Tax=Maliponia aquimaris TaxID=1673631 RepID=UPI0015952C2E|nr:hypothetical protein [Maliponia aquimaris]
MALRIIGQARVGDGLYVPMIAPSHGSRSSRCPGIAATARRAGAVSALPRFAGDRRGILSSPNGRTQREAVVNTD